MNNKNWLKENWFRIISPIIVIVLFAIFFNFITNNKNESGGENKIVFFGTNISSATQITCTYPQVLMAVYNNGEILHELPKPETNPMIFTFSNLDNPDMGQLSYIDATQTISTVSIVKFVDDKEKLVYLEGMGKDYLTVHSIYKKSGVSTYSKNINFMGTIPEVASAMGSCVGY